ncbi:hypothetical protein H6G81_34415 [Scytonema hofmannii FACHB-248]|uniref:Uncharacterized protein n=1 Tax=Scytonema hofmannii FACHB-248 TaxID=1842502 RepID=A0ABR8H0V1_9CYAN|nr:MULTISPECIES: hypothetical protein [Nostocales]MBD2609450.1 hypothetical protein [Scytonema hofmannii FACHB-248]
MAFECSGTAYCQNSDSAVVSIKFQGSELETLRYDNAPICIVIDDSTTQNKCYRFAGKDIYNINFFEIFLCGTNPGYVAAAGGVTPAFNGVAVFGGGEYRYLSSTASITQVTGEINRNPSTPYSAGDCAGCLISAETVKVTITDKNNNKLYEKSGVSPQIKVACDGCAPGEIKCACEAYPGYCCIPCSEIISGIKSVRATVRSLSNG